MNPKTAKPKTDRCLFIGGPIDGERREVELWRNYVEVAERGPLGPPRKWHQGDELPSDHECIMPSTRYREAILGDQKGHYRVFMHEAIKQPDALRMLCEGYHPGEAIRGPVEPVISRDRCGAFIEITPVDRDGLLCRGAFKKATIVFRKGEQ